MKLSILFFPNTQKPVIKTGKIPMYLRVILDRRKAEMRLNIEVTPKELKLWDPITMRFKDREMTANATLNEIDKNFENFRHHHATTLYNYSIRTIRDKIMGIDSRPDPFITKYIDDYYQSVIFPNQQMAEGTKRNYRKALKHLRTYLALSKNKHTTIRGLNMAFAYGFRDYLLGTFPGSDRVGMKEPSALDNIKRLRTIFDRAVEQELIPLNPFKKIRLKNRSAQRGRLDISQVKKIYELDLREFRTQQPYKDMFLFSVFTGLSYADATKLKQTDLNRTGDGNIRLFTRREKTDIITEMILPKQAAEIIERYKNTAEMEITGAVLPRRSNKEVNVQLKVLANMAGIPIKLTTHIARHTFRQLLAEADIYEMGVIKRMMGHSSHRDIDGIYYLVTENRLLEAKRKFELYLEKSLL